MQAVFHATVSIKNKQERLGIRTDMELVLDFAERVLVFSAGQLLLDGKTREVFRNTAALEAASVLPPQMTRLSARLSDLLPPADTVEEMERAIRMKRGQSA